MDLKTFQSLPTEGMTKTMRAHVLTFKLQARFWMRISTPCKEPESNCREMAAKDPDTLRRFYQTKRSVVIGIDAQSTGGNVWLPWESVREFDAVHSRQSETYCD